MMCAKSEGDNKKNLPTLRYYDTIAVLIINFTMAITKNHPYKKNICTLAISFRIYSKADDMCIE